MAADDSLPAPGLDGLGRFVNRRELGLLRPVLEAGETVHYAVEGSAGDRRGLLAATDRRIVWVVHRWFRPRVRSFPYDSVERLDVIRDADESVITLVVPGGDFTVARCARHPANEFGTRAAEAARRATSTFRLVIADPGARTLHQTARELELRLDRVDRMLERGSMTAAEHKVARRRLLEQAGLPTDLADAKGQVSEGGKAAVRGEAEPGRRRPEVMDRHKAGKPAKPNVKRF